MTVYAQKVLVSLRRRGLLKTLMLCKKNIAYEWRWYLDRRFDRTFGTDTSSRIEIDELDIQSVNRGEAVYYEPTPTRVFKAILSQIDVDQPNFTFIDLGSGKGRCLLLAADLPFEKIVGVEFSPELYGIAKRNVDRYQSASQKCFNIEPVCTDVLDYVIPDKPLVFYMYHPFKSELMSRILDNIKASVQAHPRPIVMIYYAPLLSSLIEERGFLRNKRSLRLPYDYTREQQRPAVMYWN